MQSFATTVGVKGSDVCAEASPATVNLMDFMEEQVCHDTCAAYASLQYGP